MSSSFFYAKQLDVLRRAAVRLNKSTDADQWGAMLANVTAKYRARFLQNDTGIFSDNADGRGTQAMMGSQALALAFPDQSLLSDAERQAVGQALALDHQRRLALRGPQLQRRRFARLELAKES